MNYELAKELKDAGWSQKGMDCNWLQTNEEDSEIYAPTLSELIDACGYKFGSLWRFEDDAIPNAKERLWGAKLEWNYRKEANDQYGSTPEEAVARLWLALNPPTATPPTLRAQ